MTAPTPAKDSALEFIRAYAKDHQFFTGGDVLSEFRASGLPYSDQDWRNKWGAVISDGAKRGWYVKAGRVKPSSKQSHTTTLVQWQSRIYSGEQSLVGTTAQMQIEEIRKDFVLRKIDLRTALWRAYEFGAEQKT